MRYKLSPLFTEVSGRNEGFVFSKNKAGLYLKSFVPPSNPQTESQVHAREVFAQISPLWSQLSTSVRSDFNTFANQNYLPLYRKSDTSAYTGRQAFQALCITSQFAIDFFAGYTGVDTQFFSHLTMSSAETYKTLALPTTPPAAYLQSNLFSLGAFSSAISSIDFSYSGLTQMIFTLNLATELPAATYTTQNIRIGGSAFGLALYVSNEVIADGIQTQNDFESKIGMTKVVDKVTVTTASAYSDVGFTLAVTSPNLPKPTGWRKITMIAYTEFGGQKVLGTKYLNFSS